MGVDAKDPTDGPGGAMMGGEAMIDPIVFFAIQLHAMVKHNNDFDKNT